jgi:hypothetical protein
MKKHRDADELAARLSAAANQPPVLVNFPAATPPRPEASSVAQPESVAEDWTPAREPRRRKSVRARGKQPDSQQRNDGTVPISLRPDRDLLTRYVVAASERTRESGRVISAQQIMLEILERWP